MSAPSSSTPPPPPSAPGPFAPNTLDDECTPSSAEAGAEVIRCPSCKYDLAGLGRTGVCPECAQAFDKVILLKQALAERASRAERGRFWAAMPFAVLGWLSPCALLGVVPNTMGSNGRRQVDETTIGSLLAWTIAIGGWLLVYRKSWRSRAERLLVFLIPLLLLASVVYLDPNYSRVWLVVFATPVALVARAALRWSPARSLPPLFFLGVGPLLLISLFMGLHGLALTSHGYKWSEYDFPFVTGWRALTPTECLWLSLADFMATGALTAIIFLYARWSKRQLLLRPFLGSTAPTR